MSTKFGQNSLRNAKPPRNLVFLSDRGDFPRIIVIALFVCFFFLCQVLAQSGTDWNQIGGIRDFK